MPGVAAIVTMNSRRSDATFVLPALADQDYPRLAVLVLCDTQGDQANQVRELLPSAEVADPKSFRSLRGHQGPFASTGAVNNWGASLIRGADYLLFLTDRIALAPDAVSLLVGDAEQSQEAMAGEATVGIVGPKLIDADDGLTLRDLGGTADRLAVRIPVVGANEMDQGQHNEARDRFVAPTEALLVRRDAFELVGGFDPALDGDGAVVDMCWRIQLSGARVRVLPMATGAMRSHTAPRTPETEEFGPGELAPGHERVPGNPETPGNTAKPAKARFFSGPSARQHEHRARLRTMLKCYGWVHLLPAVVLAAVLAGGEILFAALRGRFDQASDVAKAWVWNVRHIASTVAMRRTAKRYRRVRDADLHRLQQRGSVRLADWFRFRLSPEGGQAARTRIDESVLGTWRRHAHRTVWAVWLGIVVLIAFGSRHLLTDGVAAYGQFARFPDLGTMFGSYLDGWRSNGLGAAGIGPAAMGLLGLGGVGMLGATGLLRSVAIWGLVLAAPFGMWRLCASLPSRNGRLVALVLYAVCPLPYNALTFGRWDVLLAYAAAPVIVLYVSRLVGTSPQRHLSASRGVAARLALVLAVACAFEPFVLVLALAVATALTLTELVRRTASGESLGAPLVGMLRAALAVALAIVAHLPWILEFESLSAYLSASLGGATPSTPTSLAALLRFQTGPLGELPLGYGLLVAAAVPLLIGRGTQLRLAIRGWLVGLVGFAVAWMMITGWAADLGSPVLGSAVLGASLVEVCLAFAAVGLCWAAAAGPPALAKSERPVTPRPRPQQDMSPRLRAAMVTVSVIAVGSVVLPTTWATIDGDWSAPSFDHQVPLGLLDDRGVGSDYRVLWLGAPEVLPMRGTDLGVDGLAAGTSVRGYPDVRHSWTVPTTTGDERLADAVRHGLAGDTLRLGRLLGSFGILYVVVVERSGPSYTDGWERPVSPTVSAALASQIDLRPLAADPSVQVYRNEAWWSSRSQFEQAIPVDFADNPADLVVSDLTDGIGVLTDYRSATSQSGPVGATNLLVAESYDPGWQLEIGDEAGGEVVKPTPALGWAMRFDPLQAGPAALKFERPATVTSRIAAHVLIWLALVWVAIGQPTPFADRLGAVLGARSGRKQRRSVSAVELDR